MTEILLVFAALFAITIIYAYATRHREENKYADARVLKLNTELHQKRQRNRWHAKKMRKARHDY